MDQPEFLEVEGDTALFRPLGRFSLQQAADLITAAIIFVREQKIRKLLVVTIGMTGFDPPSLPERYFLVREWARAAGGVVRIAAVAKPEMIDPRKFGVTVAANAGLVGDVFLNEPEALAWLQLGVPGEERSR